MLSNNNNKKVFSKTITNNTIIVTYKSITTKLSCAFMSIEKVILS